VRWPGWGERITDLRELQVRNSRNSPSGVETKGDPIMASIQTVPAVPAVKTLGIVLSGSSLKGDKVVNYKGEDLGKIEEIMIDLDRGRVAYAVLSFGGFLGLGDKLFAIPWQAITVDTAKKQLILNADRALLEKAPGFDKDNWPDMADLSLGTTLYGYYGYKPYWA
jgi:sporulation protein YlmC with PRC-barrel domain